MAPIFIEINFRKEIRFYHLYTKNLNKNSGQFMFDLKIKLSKLNWFTAFQELIPSKIKWILRVGLLVGCFGFNGPLRQYFSLYWAVSQREEERKEKERREKKCPNNPHPHLLQAQKALALLLSKLVGRPGTGSLPRTIAPPDHP